MKIAINLNFTAKQDWETRNIGIFLVKVGNGILDKKRPNGVVINTLR